MSLVEKAESVTRAWKRLGECEDEFGACSEFCGEYADLLDGAIADLDAALVAERGAVRPLRHNAGTGCV